MNPLILWKQQVNRQRFIDSLGKLGGRLKFAGIFNAFACVGASISPTLLGESGICLPPLENGVGISLSGKDNITKVAMLHRWLPLVTKTEPLAGAGGVVAVSPVEFLGAAA
jgi:hypothetical protein